MTPMGKRIRLLDIAERRLRSDALAVTDIEPQQQFSILESKTGKREDMLVNTGDWQNCYAWKRHSCDVKGIKRILM
ncbi:hypothetical protein DPMN_125798 [Dreissena polymorpha]|uniref:Uncharacterized protein n=1 Tax=Dreissena polymorpha TaxID=45954 RepID=A0A9D4GVY3_DREPO|nr:hypothetical protein DPMN_125798 [Dreissena polymorpha]